MIVDSAIYCAGRRENIEGDLGAALRAARLRDGCFLWIGLHDPLPGELEKLTADLRLHPSAVQDAGEPHQRPKLEVYDDTLFVVLKTMHYREKTSTIDVAEIQVFSGDGFVVTVRKGEGNPLRETRRRLEADPALLCCGPSAVLYAVCDEVVDTYGVVAHEIESDVIELERRVFGAREREVAEDIYQLKREVVKFRAAEDPLQLVLEGMARGRVDLHPGTEEHFRSVRDHLARVDITIDALNELLTGILTAHLTLLAFRQNEDVRKISAWAAIIAVPTMIAGVYGMNFDYMPELHWLLGYPLALSFMAAACLVLHRGFRRAGWL